MPTAVEKAITEISLRKEGVAGAKRIRDGLFEHDTEFREKVDRGIATISHTVEDEKEPVLRSCTEGPSNKHRKPTFAFATPGRE